MLRVKNVVHRDQVLVLAEYTRPNSPELLHVSPRADDQPKVNAEGADVRPSLAGDPEYAEVAVGVVLDELGVVDGSDAELPLHGGDQGRALKEGPSKGLDGAGEDGS